VRVPAERSDRTLRASWAEFLIILFRFTHVVDKSDYFQKFPFDIDLFRFCNTRWHEQETPVGQGKAGHGISSSGFNRCNCASPWRDSV
jgi:hypothetical protein